MLLYKVTESAPRGEGRLIVRVHPGGLKEFYYRYRLNERDRLLRIGRFEQTPGDGEQSLHPSTVSKVVTGVWQQLAAEDAKNGVDNPIKRFVFRDLRRTCETQLASLGVNLEIRAQLLSHGRSGVQAKHYDRHTYITEKRRALNKWVQHLTRVISSRPAKSSGLTDLGHITRLPAVEKT